MSESDQGAPDDDMTEIYDAQVPRVDLVGKAANGVPGFLLMKQDGSGLMSPDDVRALIGKSAPEPAAAAVRDDVTMSGSPAAMAKMIHEAAQRVAGPTVATTWTTTPTFTIGADQTLINQPSSLDVARSVLGKAEKTAAAINDLPDSDFAYIESGGEKDDTGKTTPRSLRHFPIMDAAHVRNALARASSSPNGDKAMPKIRAAATKFGIDVTKEQPMTTTVEDVVKADMEASDLIADASPGSTAESVPGSPDWEQMDGDTAMAALSVLGRVKAVIEWLAGREGTEVVTGADTDDMSNVWNLEDAACAVDCAIDTLAGFAAGEQLAAEMPGEMEAVGKAAAVTSDVSGLLAPLGVLEGIAPLTKAGKVLSAANEASIRGAVESLQKVLASLPVPMDESGLPVAKGATTMTAPTAEDDARTAALRTVAAAGDAGAEALGVIKTAAEGAQATATEDVEKAKGDPQVAVYDENGKLIGTVDQTDITMLADPGTAEPDEPAPVDDPASMTPTPAPEVGVPAGNPAPVAAAPVAATVAKSTTEPTTDIDIAALVKSQVDEKVKEALTEQEAANAALVKGLEDRIAHLEAPATPKVGTRGAVPPKTVLRGQEQGGGVDTSAAAELRKEWADAPDATTQKVTADAMQTGAIAALEALHRAGPTLTR